MKNTRLYQKVLGCMTGAAMGDSMGSTVECLHHLAIKKHFGEIDDLRLSKGRISDDTLIRLATYGTIAEKRGRISALDLAERWMREVTPREEFWITELFVSAQLHMGLSPRETGLHNIRADDAAMAIDPIGVINCCNPRNAAADARDIAGISQKGIEVDSAMAVAAAVATAFVPNVKIEEVIESARKFSSPPVSSKIDKALTIVGAQSSVRRIYSRLYDEVAIQDGSEDIVKRWRKSDPRIMKFQPNGISLGISGAEVVPAAISFFYFARGEARKTIRMCVGYGRDSDTIAGISGALAGAYTGTSSFRKDTVAIINRRNKISLERLAEKMIQPVQNVWEESESSVENGRELLRAS
ncbi:MAG: ADP-ribosylglycohydrolase family protein [Thaumarchaeota archaeon]|nr:ADP-ribosylglycohydrolase family protein [Nitrososphaerota archaeon]